MNNTWYGKKIIKEETYKNGKYNLNKYYINYKIIYNFAKRFLINDKNIENENPIFDIHNRNQPTWYSISKEEKILFKQKINNEIFFFKIRKVLQKIYPNITEDEIKGFSIFAQRKLSKIIYKIIFECLIYKGHLSYLDINNTDIKIQRDIQNYYHWISNNNPKIEWIYFLERNPNILKNKFFNWIVQICIYYHIYINRIILVIAKTGIGKSLYLPIIL